VRFTFHTRRAVQSAIADCRPSCQMLVSDQGDIKHLSSFALNADRRHPRSMRLVLLVLAEVTFRRSEPSTCRGLVADRFAMSSSDFSRPTSGSAEPGSSCPRQPGGSDVSARGKLELRVVSAGMTNYRIGPQLVSVEPMTIIYDSVWVCGPMRSHVVRCCPMR